MFSWNVLIAAAREAKLQAPGLRAVTLAQWALESGRGTSKLARQHANFAGLKWRPEMAGFAVPIQYDAHDGADTYCGFASEAAFIAGYWRFIGRAPYKGWEAHADDPEGYIRFLEACGYASTQNYAAKVLALLPEAKALLSNEQEAVRPNRLNLAVPFDLQDVPDPDFMALGEVRHKFIGKRPNGLEGAIVHYDAGRTRPRTGNDPLFGARIALTGAVANGYAYVTIARNGKILLPSNMNWELWGSHAGESKCPVTGRTGVSQYYVGIEVNTPGMVYPTADPDKFVPYFDAVQEEYVRSGVRMRRVKTDSQGRATIANPAGEIYRRSQVRIVTSAVGNIRPSAYVPYTTEQFDSLTNLLTWLKVQFPKSFRFDRVFGHDEVSPGRKIDPGGSLGKVGEPSPGLPMTMDEFRAMLAAR